jgi:hypothetical protein
MRKIIRLGAITVTSGLLALGGVAGSGGAANAITPTTVTTCSFNQSVLAVGVIPNCSSTGTIIFPTSLTIDLNPGGLTAGILTPVFNLMGGIQATYSLACIVNGTPVSSGTHVFAPPDPFHMVLTLDGADLQALVGSPVPNRCVVSVSDSTVLGMPALGVGLFNLQFAVTSTVTTPGAMWQSNGVTGAGEPAVLCADDQSNGDAGEVLQGFVCLSDLADFFAHTATGQLVHNGDCVAEEVTGHVALQLCSPGTLVQRWATGTGTNAPIINELTGHCLTAPSPLNGHALAALPCTGAANQKWNIPSPTPGSGS